jgi:tryptophan synthase beta chain
VRSTNLDAKEKGEERVVLFNLSGHGHFDLSAFDAYIDSKLQDYDYPEEAIQAAQKKLPEVKVPA